MKKSILFFLLGIICVKVSCQWQIIGSDALYTNTGKVLINSASSNYGQLQILSPASAEASMSFVGFGSNAGSPPQSGAGDNHIWTMGCNIWGNGGHVFGIGNREYASQNGRGQIFFVKSNGTVGVGTTPEGQLHIDAGPKTGIEGKVLIRSGSNSHGQLQIMNPVGPECSVAFIGSGTAFGTVPQSSAGNSSIWIMGNNVWGNGGNVFGIGNVDYASQHGGNGQIFGISSNGNIAVGLANAGNYKFNVAGKIRADEIVVNTTGADFVFEPTYKLRTLSELETFIKANIHLPDIAPAKEMQQNGVSAGEMQAKLLQKVEELTLYVIEQDKKLENRTSELEKLKEVVKRQSEKIEMLESNIIR